MNGILVVNLVVHQGAAVVQLLASKDEALLIRGIALLYVDLHLDIVDGIQADLHLRRRA